LHLLRAPSDLEKSWSTTKVEVEVEGNKSGRLATMPSRRCHAPHSLSLCRPSGDLWQPAWWRGAEEGRTRGAERRGHGGEEDTGAPAGPLVRALLLPGARAPPQLVGVWRGSRRGGEWWGHGVLEEEDATHRRKRAADANERE